MMRLHEQHAQIVSTIQQTLAETTSFAVEAANKVIAESYGWSLAEAVTAISDSEDKAILQIKEKS